MTSPWGFSMQRPFSPRPGDTVAVEVEGIGRLENTWAMPSWLGDGGRWGHEELQIMNWRSWLPPRKLTWNLKMMVSSRNLLFQGFIFRFHVSFPGSIVKNVVGDGCQWIFGGISWSVVDILFVIYTSYIFIGYDVTCNLLGKNIGTLSG